jgi:hypothetical protein
MSSFGGTTETVAESELKLYEYTTCDLKGKLLRLD